jgi:hypothetical protein
MTKRTTPPSPSSPTVLQSPASLAMNQVHFLLHEMNSKNPSLNSSTGRRRQTVSSPATVRSLLQLVLKSPPQASSATRSNIPAVSNSHNKQKNGRKRKVSTIARKLFSQKKINSPHEVLSTGTKSPDAGSETVRLNLSSVNEDETQMTTSDEEREMFEEKEQSIFTSRCETDDIFFL